MVQVIVELEVEALYVFERGHDLYVRVRAELRDDRCMLAQLAADSDPERRSRTLEPINTISRRSDTHLLCPKDRVVHLYSRVGIETFMTE